MVTPGVYVSHPHVLIAGQVNAGVSDNTLSIMVEETVEGLYRAEVTLNNYGLSSSGRADYLYFGRDVLDFGAEITLQLGRGSPPGQVFKGRITGLEAGYPAGGSTYLTVLAEDSLQELRMARRTRSFENVTDEDVIRQIASEHSLTPQIDLSGPSYASLAQVNLSDLAFLRERARSTNAELWVEDTTLYVMNRTQRDGETVTLTYGVNLLGFRVRADLAHQCTEMRVTGWDVGSKSAIEGIGDSQAISSELEGGTGGSSILQQALGERKEQIVHTVCQTSQEADDLAKARYRERARRFVTGTGTADGDGRIRVGALLNLSELGDLFDGTYYVVRARHVYDREYGFRTEFDVERPGIGSN